jgi:hypothetical protein
LMPPFLFARYRAIRGTARIDLETTDHSSYLPKPNQLTSRKAKKERLKPAHLVPQRFQPARYNTVESSLVFHFFLSFFLSTSWQYRSSNRFKKSWIAV